MRRATPAEYCLIAGIVGCLLLAITAIWRLPAAAQSWLAAYLFWAGLPVGALFVTLVHGLTGGRWGVALRLPLAGMVRTMPLAALFLVPVLLAAPHIYPWAHAGGKGWLGLPFFVVRAVIYIGLWNAIAFGVDRYRQPNGRLLPGFGWPALIVLFGTTTLAAFDWIMTLEPRWTSTIYGLLITSGWVLSAMAVAVAAIAIFMKHEPESLDALARIMLALIILWGYLSVIQLVVIWESDLSAEIPWYLRRSSGGWSLVAALFAAGEFVIPFLVLLWQPLRRSPTAVMAAALTTVVAHLGEIWWLTVPDFSRPFGWTEPLAVIAIGGCGFFVAGRRFAPGVPVR